MDSLEGLMTTHDEQRVSRGARRLAEHADPDRGVAPRATETKPRRVLAPMLAAASVAVLVGVVAVLAAQLDNEPSGPAAEGSQSAVSSPPIGSPPGTEGQMKLNAVTPWTTERHVDCSTWSPTDSDVVVEVDRLDAECVAKAPRGSVTVFSAPYTDEAPFGVTWTETTRPWRTIDGHEVRRLASGPLAEISSRVVDAVVCVSCDQVFLVLGPDPERVRSIVDSA